MKSKPNFRFEDHLNDYDAYVTHALANFAALHRSMMKARVEAMGITFAEFNIVGCLLRYPEGMSQTQIAKVMELTPATVSVALEKLEKKNVILRSSESDDSRVKTVKVNYEALHTGEEIHLMLDTLEKTALKGIKASQAEELRSLINKMTNNLRQLQDKS